ncbi:hypothetical protein Tco_0778914 [Tanacetum coccineum]
MRIMNEAILASSSEVPSVLEFLQRRKLEAKKACKLIYKNHAKGQEVAASEFSHLNHSLSHRPVSVKPDISKPDISKASSAGGKLHILKPSCERNGITPTPKESLSPTSGSKVPNSPLTGESNLLIRLMENCDVNVHLIVTSTEHRSFDSDMEGKNEESYKFPIAVQQYRQLDVTLRLRSSDAGPPHHDFSLMDILPGKSTSYILDSWYSLVAAKQVALDNDLVP